MSESLLHILTRMGFNFPDGVNAVAAHKNGNVYAVNHESYLKGKPLLARVKAPHPVASLSAAVLPAQMVSREEYLNASVAADSTAIEGKFEPVDEVPKTPSQVYLVAMWGSSGITSCLHWRDDHQLPSADILVAVCEAHARKNGMDALIPFSVTRLQDDYRPAEMYG